VVISVLSVAGCSGGDVNQEGEQVIGRYGLKASELIALKKAHKGTGNLKKVLTKLENDQLREQGVVVETTPGKKAGRPR
jgi:hypothetical protein